ncbi:glycoside hydrolase family 3 N-terminal domain-containing protein [Lipingzhangella sp. LS1_29]|uniref:Glycoside hydrolase family 3 N-terminal domain-containing protein n=1 Tax=Lipingzhangella rawalii TaxID=2055835 RepID=A0ABU2H9J1_9ACTN|nr:glycoside hydrolase family 3 N-terminal domain-containing protein [Lipingzhangella rawalii]MDS1271991.1 glycoside hydrolase family 3 N-terminal domain-containing protein [Lipingzhangella rawalii]
MTRTQHTSPSHGRRPDRDPSVVRMLHTVLMPGFSGTADTLPDWLLRALDEGLGGVAYFTPNLATGAEPLSTRLHAHQPRLLIASDEEGGPVTRMDAGTGSPYPGNAALGTIDDPATTHEVARSIGADLRSAGVDINLAPPVDVNVNPHNPVIGVRAFGADPDTVQRHGVAFVQGLQSTGVAATLKHYPGHGDTHTDSHRGLPVIDRSVPELAERELVPFAAGVAAGARLVMPGHIRIPALGEAPASVNPRAYNLLRGQLGFDGPTVTDALDMRALSYLAPAGSTAARRIAEAAVAALRAGADLLCLGNPNLEPTGTDALVFGTAMAALRDAVARGDVPLTRLAEASARITALAARSEHIRSTTAADATASPASTASSGNGPAAEAVDPPARVRLGARVAQRALGVRGPVGQLAGANHAHLVDLRRTSTVIERPPPWLATALRDLGIRLHVSTRASHAAPTSHQDDETLPVVVLTDDAEQPHVHAELAKLADSADSAESAESESSPDTGDATQPGQPVLVVTGWPRPAETQYPRVVWTLGDSRAGAWAAARALVADA